MCELDYDHRYAKIKRKWKYTEGELSPGQCYDCGLWYGCDAWADVTVENDIWEMINPSHHKGGGLLCFNCMVMRLAFLGLEKVKFYVGSGPFAYADETPWGVENLETED